MSKGFDRLGTPKRSVVLIGMMGCGKSTIGRLLARRLGWGFVDTDALVEAEAGCAVRDIFARLGESSFRELEAGVIAALPGGDDPRVVAVGGGAVMRDDNLQALRRLGTLVHLRVSPPELARRLGAAQHRPLLATEPDKAATLAALVERRRQRYEMADVVVATDGFTVGQAARAVLSAVLGFERDGVMRQGIE